MTKTINNYSNNNYSPIKNVVIGTLGLVAGWESETYLRKGLRYPIQKHLQKALPEIQGIDVRPYVTTAIEQTNLQDKLKIIDINRNNYNQILPTLGKSFQKDNNKFVSHILRMNSNSQFLKAVVAGRNACFSPSNNAVICNFKEFGMPIFHEIAHKQHSISKNILIKALSKIRGPLAFLGGLGTSLITLSTDKRDKNDKNYRLNNHIKDHCGLYSALCILPRTLEEVMANIDGTKIAKRAGISGELLQKVKKCHKTSIIAYTSSLMVIPAALTIANKIRDYICSFKDKKPSTK